MLQNISAELIMVISLIFARIGSALLLFPGISTSYVPMNARLIIALTTSLVLYPILQEYMPKYPISLGQFLAYITMEVMLGLIISIASKICFSALDVVGSIVSMQSGLSAATFFDPAHNSQTSIISHFLLIIAYTMIFVTDTHYLFFEAIVDSYRSFSVGEFPNVGNVSDFVSQVVNQSFLLAFKLASPFIAVSIGFLISNGILSRLMPNLQVFFVVTPIQILVMFVILFIVVNFMLGKFIEAIRASIHLRLFV